MNKAQEIPLQIGDHAQLTSLQVNNKIFMPALCSGRAQWFVNMASKRELSWLLSHYFKTHETLTNSYLQWLNRGEKQYALSDCYISQLTVAALSTSTVTTAEFYKIENSVKDAFAPMLTANTQLDIIVNSSLPKNSNLVIIPTICIKGQSPQINGTTLTLRKSSNLRRAWICPGDDAPFIEAGRQCWTSLLNQLSPGERARAICCQIVCVVNVIYPEFWTCPAMDEIADFIHETQENKPHVIAIGSFNRAEDVHGDRPAITMSATFYIPNV